MSTKNAKLVAKRSSVQGKVPTTADLDYGELGVNTEDGKLYIKKNHTTPVIAQVSIDQNNVAITGGTINATSIGATTPSTGAFTDLTTTTQATIQGMSIGQGGISKASSIYNLAIGNTALQSVQDETGDFQRTFNTAIGWAALQTSTATHDNTAIGAFTLQSMTDGTYNTAIGAHTLQALTTGSRNTAIGPTAGGGGWESVYLTTGSDNTYLGYGVVPSTTGENNHVRMTGKHFGIGALSLANSLVSAPNTVAIGENAMRYATYPVNATAIGRNALRDSSQDVAATAIIPGKRYLIRVAGDTNWVAVGAANNNVGTNFYANAVATGTGIASTTGSRYSVAIGDNAAAANLTGSGTTAIGGNSLAGLKYGDGNLAIGTAAGESVIGSEYLTLVGAYAGMALSTSLAATSIVVGNYYVILTIGTTDFTTCGATANTVGLGFIATSTPTGTGTVATNGRHNVLIGYRAGGGQTSNGLPNGTAPANALKHGRDNVCIGAITIPSSNADNNSIIIGTGAVGLGSNTAVMGTSTTTVTGLYGDVKALNGNLVVPQTSGKGIKVNTTTPAWGWRDITASMKARASGTAVPSFTQYAGTSLYAYQFSNSATQELFIEFHVPHDYVPGSDMHIHTHWSQTTADTGNAVKWNYDVLYAKGHNQAAFPNSVTTVSVTQNCSSTARQHMIAETQLSSSGRIGGAALEVDGVVLVRMYRNPADAADTATIAPYAHFCDIHYQSTNMATAGKSPDFYA